jgi:hypothetical protein
MALRLFRGYSPKAMLKRVQRIVLIFAVGWFCLGAGMLSADEFFAWRAADKRMDADIQALPLAEFLKKLAASTGWEIFVEPDTRHTVSAKFKNVSPGDGLRLLLGKLNFALLPHSNAPPSLFVFSTSMRDATQRILPAKGADQQEAIIRNELIVTLKPGSGTNIDDLARELGAKVVGRADELNAYRLQFDDEAAANAARQSLGSHSDVAGVDSNFLMPRPTEPFSLGLGLGEFPFTLKPNPAGADQRLIGIIDTAVNQLDPAREAFIKQRLSLAGDFAPDGNSPTHGDGMVHAVLQALNAAANDPAGSSIRLVLADVYGSRPHTTSFEVAKSILALVNDYGVNLINFSLGSSSSSEFLHQVIQRARENDVIMFGAAGNEPGTAPTYPAAYPEVLAVTAADRHGNLAPYANSGSFVELIAPGAALIPFRNQSFFISGTSVSSAYATGLAAGYSERTGTPISQIPVEMRNIIGVNTTPAR